MLLLVTDEYTEACYIFEKLSYLFDIFCSKLFKLCVIVMNKSEKCNYNVINTTPASSSFDLMQMS